MKTYGHRKFLLLICMMSFSALSHSQDVRKAVKIYEEAIAASSSPKAFSLMEKSSDMGYPPAHRWLYPRYENIVHTDELLGRKGHVDDMFKYTLRAAQTGDSIAMVRVANYYQNGVGTKKDTKTAEGWYEESIAHENTAAELAFGKFYLTKDAGNNLEEARFWFKKAADRNDWEAYTYYYYTLNNLQPVYDMADRYEKKEGYSPFSIGTAEKIYHVLSDLGVGKATYLFAKKQQTLELRLRLYAQAMEEGFPVPAAYFA